MLTWKRVGLVLWALVTVSLAVDSFYTHRTLGLVEENKALYHELAGFRGEWCEGLKQVNETCEMQFIEIMQRLGLDEEMMPLVTTALWKRAAGTRVSVARQKLGAKKSGATYLDKPAIGGPSEGTDARR